MRLRVKLFATYREIVGAKELTWTTHTGTTLEAFFEEFLGDHPRLAPYRDTMMVAVNQAFTDPRVVLHEGDEVALLPPVSGGIR